MAEVAIAILNFNGEEHLKKFLPSVIEHSGGHEIIVGDNGSIDNSIEVLQKHFPSVRVVDLKNNYGYAGGYNRLIAQIDAQYIVLLNSDVEVTPGWISPLLGILKSDQTIAAIQPKILSYNNKDYFEYAGAAGGFIDKYGYPFCRGRVFGTLEKDVGQYDNDIDIFWASGACFMVNKNAFMAVEGFDESFFAHMEEIDLNWRFQANGYSIRYTGGSKVYHLGGGTLSYSSPRKTYLNFRNSWLTILKNTQSNRIGVFSIRFLLDLVSVLFFLARFQPTNAYAVIKALVFIAFKRRKTKSKLGNSTKNSSIIAISDFSLVWQYYIRNKKKYRDLIPD
jgi:GT2 family glycosyltransferase